MAEKDAQQRDVEAKTLDEKTQTELKREARARLRRLTPSSKAAVISDVIGAPVKGPLAGFVTFLRERAVVGLAIGFVVGTQVQGVVKQFITSFIDPLFALVSPGTLSDKKWVIWSHGQKVDFAWGSFVYGLIVFLFTLFIIYAVIKLLRLDRLDKKDN
jgi:large-conductance mechanosensitive channel